MQTATLALILALILISPISSCSSLGVQGAGGLLRFIGNGETKSQIVNTRLLTPNHTEEFTVTMWYRQPHPWIDAFDQESGGLGSFFSLHSYGMVMSAHVESILFTCADYLHGTCSLFGKVLQSKAFTCVGEEDEGWKYLWASFSTSSASLTLGKYLPQSNMTVIDSYVVNDSPDITDTTSVYWTIGSGKELDYDLAGDVDSTCIYSKALTVDEAVQVAKLGCRPPTISEDLLMQFDFDDPNDIFFEGVGNRTGAIGTDAVDIEICSTREVEAYRTELASSLGPLYQHSSSAPVNRGQVVVIRNPLPGSQTDISLVCMDCDSAAFVYFQTVPKFGSLCVAQETTTSLFHCNSSSFIQVGSNTTLLESRLLKYIASSDISVAGTVDSFDAVLLYSNGTLVQDTNPFIVRIVTNTAPTLFSSDLPVSGEQPNWVWLPRGQNLLIDPDGQTNLITAEILSVSNSNSYDFYDCERCAFGLFTDNYNFDQWLVEENRITEFPHTVKGLYRRIVGVPLRTTSSDTDVVISYRTFDGFEYSNIAEVNIYRQNAKNSLPRATSAHWEIDEESSKIFPLLDHVSDKENDPIFFTISALPKHGSLYQVDPLSGVPFRKIQVKSESAKIAQWVSATAQDLEGSDHWLPDYTVDKVRGPPDLFPSSEDVALAWQPGTGLEDFSSFIVAFDKPVYPSQFNVYECWTPRTIYRIEAEAYDEPNTWAAVFQADNMNGGVCTDGTFQCGTLSEYPLCPLGVKSRRFRVTVLKAFLRKGWVAIDAIQLVGTIETSGQALIGRGNTTVKYLPKENFFGDDEFAVTVSDCPYYKVNRSPPITNETTMHMSIMVINVADKVTMDIPENFAQVVKSESSFSFSVAIIDSDGFKDPDGHEVSITMNEMSHTSASSVLTIPSKEIWSFFQVNFANSSVDLLLQGKNAATFRLTSTLEDESIDLNFTSIQKHCTSHLDLISEISVEVKDTALDETLTRTFSVVSKCSRFNFPSLSVISLCRTMATFVLFLSASLMMFLIKHRSSPVVMAAQLRFVVVIGLGVSMSSSSVFFFTIDDRWGSVYADQTGGNETANLACRLGILFYMMGFSLTFLPLAGKLYRIRNVFFSSMNTTRSNLIKKNKVVVWYLGLFGAIEFGMYILWLSDGLYFKREETKTIETQNMLEPMSFGFCTSPNWRAILLVIGSFHLLVFAVLAWLCNLTMRVSSAFSEAKYLRYAALGSLEIFLLSVPLSFISEKPETTLFVRSSAIILIDLSVLICVMVPKLYMIRHGVTDDGTGAHIVIEKQRKTLQAGGTSPTHSGKVIPVKA